ncbi:hypothetical protein MAPG_04938 [Magnaporthiopsis poae ATCC 64411]|uniref:Uncharacterized protein n=1 Tax=Magnaporthiopsis poae (strain ATCC 64411 / 73-15) TaxID=644358 RepID=A0A0C4DY29_MAGP6|nr:hypothetical protein MAPG_04938 [Magnaporthiopsis poae ATCC 64411]
MAKDALRPEIDLLEILTRPDPPPDCHNPSQVINKQIWETFIRHVCHQTSLGPLMEGLTMVYSAEGLAQVGAARLSFCHNKLAGKKFRFNDDNTGVTSSRPKVQSTRAALAFVNMLPSLQSLRRLAKGLSFNTQTHTAEETVALLGGSLRDSKPLVRRALVTFSWMGTTVWALLYSVFKAYDDGLSTIEIVHFCKFINHVGMQVTFIEACIKKDAVAFAQLLPDLPTQIIMSLCQLCVDLLALHQHALDQEVTPATADPPAFTGLLRDFRGDLGHIAQFAWRTVALGSASMVDLPPMQGQDDAQEGTLM